MILFLLSEPTFYEASYSFGEDFSLLTRLETWKQNFFRKNVY